MRSVLLLISMLLSVAAANGQDEEWIWVVGELSNERRHAKYEEFARRMFDYYQRNGSARGRIVRESELRERPAERVVYLGPIEAFEHPEWWEPDLRAGKRTFEIAGREFADARTAVYLANPERTRLYFLGATRGSFEDIFAVPTGRHACTVTVRGKVRFEADYVDGELAFQATPFLPPVEELERAGVSDGLKELVRARPVHENGALAPEFQARVVELLTENRALFFGETHWNVEVNALFNRLLPRLLEAGARNVFLEVPLSNAGPFDHYVGLQGKPAALFFEEVVHHFCRSASERETLEIVRAWNGEHPDERVRVGCYDLEFGLRETIEHVLTPFFTAVDPALELSLEDFLRAQSAERTFTELERALDRANVGVHPYLEPEFVRLVLSNVRATLTRGPDAGTDRQVVLNANLMARYADALKRARSVFKVGTLHAHRRSGNGAGVPEAVRVADLLEGQVATLGAIGLGYAFETAAAVPDEHRKRGADTYERFLREYRAGQQEGTARAGAHYLLNRKSGLEVLAAHAARDLATNVVWFDEPDFEALFEATNQPEFGPDQRPDFDLLLYVVRADLEPMRPLELR